MTYGGKASCSLALLSVLASLYSVASVVAFDWDFMIVHPHEEAYAYSPQAHEHPRSTNHCPCYFFVIFILISSRQPPEQHANFLEQKIILHRSQHIPWFQLMAKIDHVTNPAYR